MAAAAAPSPSVTPTGEYRWMLRREGERLTVVVLWSIGTVTGWQHVVHTQTDFAEFAGAVRSELEKAAANL